MSICFIVTPSKLSLFPRSKASCFETNQNLLSAKIRTKHKCVTPNKPRPCRMGVIPLIPNWIFIAAWIYGAVKFYSGFRHTSYKPSFRIPLAIAWPIFFAFNGRYRSNFQKSISAGRNDDI